MCEVGGRCNSNDSLDSRVGVLGTHCGPVLPGGNGSSSTEWLEDAKSSLWLVGSLDRMEIVLWVNIFYIYLDPQLKVNHWACIFFESKRWYSSYLK